jgi:hypothetical protein
MILSFIVLLSSCSNKQEKVVAPEGCPLCITNNTNNDSLDTFATEIEITTNTDLIETTLESKWIKGVHIDEAFEPPNYFLHGIPYEILAVYMPFLEEIAANGVGGMANRIVVGCNFFRTGENSGFVIRTFGHTMASAWTIYEIGYIDNTGYKTIYSSAGVLDDDISRGICDGEFLYYMHSGGNLRRIDQNGEIRYYPVFEEGEIFSVRSLKIETEGDEITVTSEGYFDWVDHSVVVNVNAFD